jgi:hypothetical protein
MSDPRRRHIRPEARVSVATPDDLTPDLVSLIAAAVTLAAAVALTLAR